jgi:predicted metalloendopeptidase
MVTINCTVSCSTHLFSFDSAGKFQIYAQIDRLLSGASFDQHGAIRDWMSNKTKEQFNKKAKCYVTQYAGVFDRQLKRLLNGQQTLGENIADNAGITAAILGYKIHLNGGSDQKLKGYEQFSNDQMFFTGYGTVSYFK